MTGTKNVGQVKMSPIRAAVPNAVPGREHLRNGPANTLIDVKRLAIGLGVAGGVALLIALVIGFVPTIAIAGECTGSYFIPARGSGWGSDSDHISLSSLCNENGFPGLFWTFVILGVALLVAAIVFQQLRAHRSETPRPVPRPAPARIDLSKIPPPSRPAVAPPSQVPSHLSSSVASELRSLKDLYDAGGLTADEFAAAKARVLRGPSAT